MEGESELQEANPGAFGRNRRKSSQLTEWYRRATMAAMLRGEEVRAPAARDARESVRPS